MFLRNQNLRWILMDEGSMVSSGLATSFEYNMRKVAKTSLYRQRADGSARMFGGYNFVVAGDWWQLPPIPASQTLFTPPDK